MPVRRSSSRPLAAVLLAALGGVGCAGAAANTDATPPAAGPPATSGRANPADAEFMTGMIHHHAQAVQMAEWAPTHDAGQTVRTMSLRILISQKDEIALMQRWLADHGEPVPEPNPRGMPMRMGGMDHEMLMPGMLTPEQMEELDRARGAEFDRLFVRFMIQHHRGALVMVEELFASPGAAQNVIVYEFASDVFADQVAEIDRMERMLAEMPAGGADL